MNRNEKKEIAAQLVDAQAHGVQIGEQELVDNLDVAIRELINKDSFEKLPAYEEYLKHVRMAEKKK